MESKDTLNLWKKCIEDCEPKTKLDCLRCISIVISNVCNYKLCPFCPHSNNWKPTSRDFMDIDTFKVISKRINEINYSGYVVLFGKGEPFLNKNLLQMLQMLTTTKNIVITNGQLGSREYLEQISKYATIKVSVHDNENLKQYEKRFNGLNVIFRNHDIKNPQISINSRCGMAYDSECNKSPCSYPFYQFHIETDGTYSPCGHNWNIIKERYNVKNTSIEEYFTNFLEKYRLKLVNGNRHELEYCNKCDANGILMGKKYIDFWRNLK